MFLSSGAAVLLGEAGRADELLNAVGKPPEFESGVALAARLHREWRVGAS